MPLFFSYRNEKLSLYFGLFLLLFLIISIPNGTAQKDSIQHKYDLFADFRFRAEHDWNSIKTDGSPRSDRSRLRIRARVGATFTVNSWTEIGTQIRTGNLDDQQGPHLTLGGNGGEFGLYQLGFEKAYLKLHNKLFQLQLGKFEFPFEKQNELFWNDNVFPDGVSLKVQKSIEGIPFTNQLGFTAAHFVITATNGDEEQSFIDAFQLNGKFFDSRLSVYPGIFFFQNISDVPDLANRPKMNYSIAQLSAEALLFPDHNISLGFDFYDNLNHYGEGSGIQTNLRGEKQGFVVSAKLGKLEQKGDFLLHFYLAYIEKYAIVDYFAQNDWARWDYSSYGVYGSRLSNFKGAEIRLGYALAENIQLILRGYYVEQLVTSGTHRENGNRIRIDVDVKF